LSACKADTTVTVRMRDDGSGRVAVSVVLDADAVKGAEAGGGKLEERVRVSDLTAAGWTVGAWTRADDGSAALRLSKPFSDPAGATAILAEVSGAVGPLRNLKVTRDEGVVSTKFAVTGTIDLARLGTGVTSDQQLVQSLQGQKVDVNTVDQALQSAARDALSVKVVADLPGGRTTVQGKAGASTAVDASSSQVNTTRVGLVALAIVLVAIAIAVLLVPGRRRRRVRPDANRPRTARVSAGPAPPPRARRGTPPTS
jgi:hypothetical protein